ncbi:Chromo-like domain superfamily [Sesbania bispinosa]|nr:Chromo-like domain superfamily [Sesbania bispinosa]
MLLLTHYLAFLPLRNLCLKLSLPVRQPVLLDQLRHFYSNHPIGCTLLAKFRKSQVTDSTFNIHHGILHHKGRLFIPQETGLRSSLLTEFHSSPSGGHSGVRGTLARLAASFSWPHMAADVKSTVSECRTCQEAKLMLQVIRDNLSHAQLRMCTQANNHRQDCVFQAGDWVYLRLQPYRQLSIHQRPSQKLAKRYFGPFKILRAIGAVAYELELPPDAKVHPVFHVSKLKPFRGPPLSQLAALPPSITGTRLDLRPLNILGSRTLRKSHGTQLQVLVQWTDQTEAKATWEDSKEFRDSYPDFNLEGKVDLYEQGNDTMLGPIKGAQHCDGPNSKDENHERPKRVKKAPAWKDDYY